MRIEVTGPPDSLGRCRYTLTWWEPSRVHDEYGQAFTADRPDIAGGWRAQEFHGVPPDWNNHDLPG